MTQDPRSVFRPRLRALPLRIAGATAWAFGMLAAGVVAAEDWTVLNDCRLIANPSNDGDSFHVQAGKRHYVFRLYFVDAPETDASIPERVGEQAEYWGLKPEVVLKLGEKARSFTRDFLKGEFTVYTRREDAMGRGERKRYYAVVATRGGRLADALVSNGLARVYGEQTDLPDGTEAKKCWARLRVLERAAKKAGLGGWAKTGLRSRRDGSAAQ
jgi:endonuclease YncB( thermonuclease family)